MQPSQAKGIWLALAAVVIILAAAGYWYFGRPIPPPVAGAAGVAPPEADLGGALYEKATNPLQDKLPDTTAPVVDPLGGLYKNPFE